jgi:hypothetical protein
MNARELLKCEKPPRLTQSEYRKAAVLAEQDYEVRDLLRAYIAGSLDQEGLDMLLGEIS